MTNNGKNEMYDITIMIMITTIIKKYILLCIFFLVLLVLPWSDFYFSSVLQLAFADHCGTLRNGLLERHPTTKCYAPFARDS